MTDPYPSPPGTCELAHRRVPDDGEAYTLPDGRTGVGDGHSAVWDLANDGGRAVPVVHDGARLCRGHASRLTDLIARTPKMVEWMRAQIEPTNQTPDRAAGYTRAGKKEPPLPLSAAAIDAADEELMYLSEWARLVAADLGEPGPSLPGARRVARSTYRPVPQLQPDTRVIGFRVLDEEGVAETVNAVVRYLLDRMEWIFEHELVGDMLTEIAKQRSTHLARWPSGDTARPLRMLRCSRCGRETVVVHPPAYAPQYVETPVLEQPRLPWKAEGPLELPRPVPLLDELGRPVLNEDGTPKVKTERRLTYSYPMLVACSETRCGERVSETYWEWARTIAESGRVVKV